MKKVKFMMAAIVILSIVGGTLAFTSYNQLKRFKCVNDNGNDVCADFGGNYKYTTGEGTIEPKGILSGANLAGQPCNGNCAEIDFTYTTE